MYLAEKHGQFLPTDLSARAECSVVGVLANG